MDKPKNGTGPTQTAHLSGDHIVAGVVYFSYMKYVCLYQFLE